MARPAEFDPLRFTVEVENEATRHRLAWIPFLHGPRGCIGQRFAMLEGLAVLANIIVAFQISSDAAEPSLGSDLTCNCTVR